MGEARKDTHDRIRYDLVPAYPAHEEALVYTKGALKYDEENWRKGMSWKKAIGALKRHLAAFEMGESRHEEGMHHLASVKFWCNALMEWERTGAGADDRRDIMSPVSDERVVKFFEDVRQRVEGSKL